MSRRPRRRAPRVLMVVENMSLPADARVWPEATALRDAGFDVRAVSPTGSTGQDAAHECIDGIEIYRFTLPAGGSATGYVREYGAALVRVVMRAIKLWWRWRFDVIHVANPPDIFFPLAWLFKPFGVRFVFDQHDLSPEVYEARFEGERPGLLGAILYRLLFVCERLSYRAADLVIVTNNTFRRTAIERGGVRAGHVVVVRNGPSLDRLRPVPPAVGVRQGWSYLLGYVGTMGPQDGVEYALRALSELVHGRGREDIGLLLVGDGDSVPELHALARSLHLEPYVTFTGRIPPDQVAPYLSALDIGLSPEPRNALNTRSTLIKTMEYMAMRKPVVAFDLDETRFTVGDAGLYAEPNSVTSFADAIERLLADETLRDELGSRGHRRVEEQFNWDRSRAALLDAYVRVLGLQPAR